MPRALRSAILLLALLAASCAPALAPAPVVTTPRHPEFVFPAAPAAMASRDLVLRQQRGWQFLQAGEARTARREFTAALRLDPRFYPAEAGLAYASLAEKDYVDAVARFDRVLRAAPKYVPALVGRGDALVGLGRADEAVKSLQDALVEDPSLVDVRRRLDVLALRSQQEALTAARRAAEAGEYDQAADAYRRAIASSPDSAFLYRELASVERRAGRSAAALENLRKAAEIDPSDARVYVQIGELLEEQGDAAGAVSAYQRARAIEPGEDVDAHLARARAQAELDRLPEEYRAIPKALQVTRADLAALIAVRLPALLAGSPKADAKVVTDVRGSWAAPWIMAVVQAGVMEPYPNHTFQPRGLVRRLDLALVATRVLGLIAARRPAAAVAWEGARPRIGDLPPGHLGYPAASTVVAAGVMSLIDGAFRPGRAVSGSEAIEVVGRLEALAR